MLSPARSAHARILQLATTRARSRSLLGNKASPCSLALLRNRGITWWSSQDRTHLGSGQGWGVCALLPPPLLPCSSPQQHPNPAPASSTCPQAGRGEQAPVQPSWLQTRGQALRSAGTWGQRALGGTGGYRGAVTPYRAGTVTLPPGAFMITSPLPLGCCSLLSNLLPEAKLGACQGCSAGRSAPPASRAGKGPGSAAREKSLSQLQVWLCRALGPTARCEPAAP